MTLKVVVDNIFQCSPSTFHDLCNHLSVLQSYCSWDYKVMEFYEILYKMLWWSIVIDRWDILFSQSVGVERVSGRVMLIYLLILIINTLDWVRLWWKEEEATSNMVGEPSIFSKYSISISEISSWETDFYRF